MSRFAASRWALAAAAACLMLAARAGEPLPIDLPTALRLAGAEHLDVRIAEQKLAEARALDAMARNRLFPWISAGVTAQSHDGNIQTVDGPVIDIEKQSLAAGLGLNLHWEPGEVFYRRLVARQQVQADEAALNVSRDAAIHQAALAYFDLLLATADADVAQATLDLSDRHLRQVQVLGNAGLLFAGDVQRTATHRARSALVLQQTRAQVGIASARLAEVLKLDPATELTTDARHLVPLDMAAPDGDLDALVASALAARPEIDQAEAQLASARTLHDGARWAPLIPTVSAQARYGGLGGGTERDGWTTGYASSQDLGLGLSWRLGPGGLFDPWPARAAASQLQQAELQAERQRQRIRLQVVERHTQMRSMREQLQLFRGTLEAAEKTAGLSLSRRERGVGAVLEDLLAEQELSSARRDYAAAIAHYNQAQYSLLWALGRLSAAPAN